MALRESKGRRDGFHILDSYEEGQPSYTPLTNASNPNPNAGPGQSIDHGSEFMAVLDEGNSIMDRAKRMKKNMHKQMGSMAFPMLAALMLLCITNKSMLSNIKKGDLSQDDVLMNNAYIPSEDYTQPRRTLSVNLGGGDCRWTNAKQADQSKPLWTSLIVSYPGSGKRTTFLQLEGLTELVSGDDHILRFEPPETKYAFMKTSYPQHHGTWGWEDRSHQALLLVRNPRWAMVSFHETLYEIDFSTSWIESYQRVNNVYTKRPPVDDWEVFRDLRFDDEIKLWGWLIDFWMEGGLLRNYKTNELVDEETFNMVLEPHIYTPAEIVAAGASPDEYYDAHCLNDVQNGCEPTAVASIEKIMAEATGPTEIAKLAATIEGKPGITMIEEEARDCVWREMAIHHKNNLNHFPDRDGNGPPQEQFLFTKPQMEKIIDELTRVRDKYSGAEWADNANAQQLVGFFNEYIAENQAELATM